MKTKEIKRNVSNFYIQLLEMLKELKCIIEDNKDNTELQRVGRNTRELINHTLSAESIDMEDPKLKYNIYKTILVVSHTRIYRNRILKRITRLLEYLNYLRDAS